MTTTARTLVMIATYNERGNIERLLEAVFATVDVDVLVIDDQSPDGTGAVLDGLARLEPRLSIVHRPGRQGVASAHLLAFRHCLDRGYARVVEMDADFSHAPEDLPRLIAATSTADVAVGSRMVPGGRIVGRSRFRDLLTTAACLYARTVLGLRVRDCTGGFRCSTRHALELLDLDAVRSRGYGMQLELNRAWALAGATVIEVPIVFIDRTVGASKMSWRILVEALIIVVRLRLGTVRAAIAPTGARTMVPRSSTPVHSQSGGGPAEPSP